MGQQQLLLIALSVIIVGAAVAVGVNMFNEGSVQAEEDALYQRANFIAGKLGEAWRTPSNMGGLGKDYTNLPASPAAKGDAADITFQREMGFSLYGPNTTAVLSGPAAGAITVTIKHTDYEIVFTMANGAIADADDDGNADFTVQAKT